MADQNEILIKITAETTQIKSLMTELKLLELSVRQNAVTAETYGKVTKDIAAKLDNCRTNVVAFTAAQQALFQSQERVKNGFTSMSGSLNQINSNIVKINPLMISFSQGLQDSGMFAMGAGMGIRSVTNNIQMMGQQMMFLRTQGYSFSQIFSSMLASMSGPMGALVLFSAVTAAIQYFTTETGKAKQQTEQFKNTIIDLIDNLNKLGKVTDEQLINMYRLEIAKLESANKQSKTVVDWVKGAPIKSDQSLLSKDERDANLKAISDLQIKIQNIQKSGLKESRTLEKEAHKEFMSELAERVRAFDEAMKKENQLRNLVYGLKGLQRGQDETPNTFDKLGYVDSSKRYGKSALDENGNVKETEFEKELGRITDQFKLSEIGLDAFHQVTTGTANALAGLMEGSMNLGEAFKELLKQVVAQAASKAIVGGILSFIPGLGGVMKNVSGGGESILPDNSLNSMGQNARFSGGNNGSMISELQRLNRNFDRLKAASPSGVYMLSKVGQQERALRAI